MKRTLALVLLVLFLAGCSSRNSQMDRALALRERLLESEGCSFDTVITADYGEDIYTFKMHCKADATGKLTFQVLEPASISGITGTVSEDAGKLTFDDQALAFATLADGQITPVCAPWVFIHTLRSGYLNACAQWEDGLQLLIDDSYQEDALQLDIKTDGADLPVYGEILWQGRRVLSLSVSDFTFL